MYHNNLRIYHVAMIISLIILIPQCVTGQDSDTEIFTLDSVYYRYRVITDTVLPGSLYVPIPIDTGEFDKEALRISGVKDFSYDVNQGFDQGLHVDIMGEVEGISIEGSLSDKATPSSTQRISDIEKMSLKAFTKHFYGGIGNLTLDLPFDVYDEIQGGRIGIHSEDKENNVNVSYAVNRGSYKRMQFVGEEGKQSPYFLEGSIVVGSEKVYVAQGMAPPTLMERDDDYTIDYERGILSFNNNNIITNYTRIEVEYQQALKDYPNTYQETDAQINVGGVAFTTMYRRMFDNKENPLTFTLSEVEIESLKVSGDSLTVLHTYADTSSQGSYIIEDNHFVFVGEGSGDYIVTFFYVGEDKGEYEYEPAINGFVYRGQGFGNYSPKKFIIPPQQHQFYGLGVRAFEVIWLEIYGSDIDLNTFSHIDDGDNFTKGGRVTAAKTFHLFSLYSEYIYYDKNFSMPAAKEEIDYQYQWNTQESMEELGNLSVGITPADFFTADIGYSILNRTHRRKFITVRPFFFQLGYQGIDSIHKYHAGFTKKFGNVSLNSRYEYEEESHFITYDFNYVTQKNYGIGLSGNYDQDTTNRGITTIASIFSPFLSFSLGRRVFNDTTFLFGNAVINIFYQGLSLQGSCEQSQHYFQKRDEIYTKVDEGEGNYVYDSTTNTYIEKEGGDYIKQIFLLGEFERVVTRSYSLEGRYSYSIFGLLTRLNYIDEENYLSHTEDVLLTANDDIYSFEINVRQDITEDARYAQFGVSNRERLVALVPVYKKFIGRAELREEREKYGTLETDRENTYSGEIGYSFFLKPLIRPKIGYAYSTIFSQYFEQLDIRRHTPRVSILCGIPIKKNSGRIELTGELIYRRYNIDDVPYFFAATKPAGLTKILGITTNLGLSGNTIFSLIYKIEFSPDNEIQQNLRLQTRIRF
jgi:hypothetical protein